MTIKDKYSPKTYDGKIKNSDQKLIELNLPSSWGEGDTFYFNGNNLRESIEHIFDINSKYTFVMTTASERAKKTLSEKGQVSIDYLFDSKKEMSKMYSTPRTHETHQLRFSPDVMDTYLETLKTMSRYKFGKDNYLAYPLIERENVHDSDRPCELINSPIIHIIKNAPDYEFRKIVEKLNSDEAYAIARKIELPQCYRMGEIKFLKEKKILPLISLPRQWSVDGEMLKNAIDFLSQFKLKHESHNSGSESDDQ